MESDIAVQEALNALTKLEEPVKNASTDAQYVFVTVEKLKADVISLKTEDSKFVDGAKGLVQFVQGVVDNIDKFTSGDALAIASGAISLIGAIGAVLRGPVGPLTEGICGLIASILSLFGGKKGSSMSEMVTKVIQDALEDFKDQSIYQHVIASLKETSTQIAELNGIVKQNGGIVSNEKKSLLKTLDFSTIGSETLSILQDQLEKNKNSQDEKKCGRLAMYCYYYSMISLQKAVVLTLQCSLLRRNGMESVYAVVGNYFYNVIPKEDQKVLAFISDLPVSRDGWWLLYRCLHTELSAPQRMILSEYREHVGCEPMKGQLCSIYNTHQSEYLYLPYFYYDSDRRRVFTWGLKNEMDAQGLFRIIGSYENCQIYGVYFGEFLYAPDYASDNEDGRKVFFWRSGNRIKKEFWEIYGGSIRNLKQNEYLYASDSALYDANRRNVFTSRRGNPGKQGDWKIVPLSFERGDLKNPTIKNVQ